MLKTNFRFRIFLENHWPIIFALILIFLLFYRWFLPNEVFINPIWPISKEAYKDWLIPSLWSFNNGTGASLLTNLAAPTLLPILTFQAFLINQFNFSLNFINQLFLFWPYLLLGPISFYYLWQILFFGKKVGALAGILFFTVNPFSLGIIESREIQFLLVYALAPLILAIAHQNALKNQAKSLIVLGLLASLATFASISGAILLIILVLTYLISFHKQFSKNDLIRTIIWFVSLPILLNLWWLIPLIFNHQEAVLSKPSEQFFLLNLDNYPNLINTLTFLPPSYLDLISEKSLGLIFFYLFPLIFLPFIIWSKKSSVWRYFLVLTLVSILLAKGPNPPFSRIYRELMERLPGFQLFADPSQFYFFLALVYSLFFAFLIHYLWQWAQGRWLKTVFFCLGFLPLIWIWPTFNQTLNISRNLETNNQAYQELNDQLSRDNNFFRTLWFPEKPASVISTSLHPAVDATELTNSNLKFLKNKTGQVYDLLINPLGEKVLQDAGIKYFLLPSEKEKAIYSKKHSFRFYKSLADKASWLEKNDQLSTDLYSVYEIEKPQDLVYVSNNWLYTNVPNADLINSYLKSQNDPTALIFTKPDQTKLLVDPNSQNKPYLFSLDLSEQKIEANGQFKVNLKIIKSEPFFFYLPKDLALRAKNWQIDNQLLEQPTEFQFNPQYYQIPLPALTKGDHTLKFRFNFKENLFSGGQIDQNFDPQSDLCLQDISKIILNENQIALGGSDGGEFFKLKSLKNTSCFARYIKLPSDHKKLRLYFDYQYISGQQPKILITESNGWQTLWSLEHFFKDEALKDKKWRSFSKQLNLAPKTNSVIVSILSNWPEDGSNLEPNEARFDNLIFQNTDLSSKLNIFYGNLNASPLASELAKVTIQRQQLNQLKIEVDNPSQPHLVVFNTTYHPNWQGLKDQELKIDDNLKVNGLTNGFIIDDNKSYKLEFIFTLNKGANIGLIISFLILLILISIYLALKANPQKLN